MPCGRRRSGWVDSVSSGGGTEHLLHVAVEQFNVADGRTGGDGARFIEDHGLGLLKRLDALMSKP